MREQLEALERELRGIVAGDLPDGDGVNVSVSLWAEKWVPRIRAILDGCAGEVEAVGYVSTRAVEALRGLSPNGVLMTSIRKSGDVPLYTHPPAVVDSHD